ncbi:MAG: RNA methyltransferase [Acidobacteriia bacterium]|nr:RNA methyltransferase [Terriglobia bacterium]MBZ5680444.1 RNA methyltransferase [Terriglobia bacterium]
MLPPAESDRLRVVLVNARNPLNIGAAARAVSNFGFHRLRVVNPFEAAFREARSAVGAARVLAEAEQYGSVAEAVADCAFVVGTTAVRHRELLHPLRNLDGDAGKIIREQLQSAPVALLFGSEKVGLSNEDLSHCHWLLHIPTRAEHISMNLGQAVAVCLFELTRATTPDKTAEESTWATAGETERLTGALLQALHASGYITRETEVFTEERVRRLIRRLSLRSGDAEALLGMLRQILWKLKSEE